MTDELGALLALAEHDAALARLGNRREALAERGALVNARAELAVLDAAITERSTARDAVLAEEQRVDAEVGAVEDRAKADEVRLYSGEITSPRELQALQGEIEQLRGRRATLEDEELAIMEKRDALDHEVNDLVARRAALVAEARDVAVRLAAAEAEIDAEIRRETEERDAAAAAVAPNVLTRYERAREATGTDGAARLVGVTCEGCHLTIPTTEAEAIRRDPARLATCDNCGRILVP